MDVKVDTPSQNFMSRIWSWRVIPFLVPIWIYKRVISPVLPPACRHYPTCSEYAVQAIQQRGVFQGIIIGTWRILRCNPWGTSGYDPVEAFRWPWQRQADSTASTSTEPEHRESHQHTGDCRHAPTEL